MDLIKEARTRTADKWYFNMYEGNRLILSYGYPSKGLAESFKRGVVETRKISIRKGVKMKPGIVLKVEQANGWKVNDHTFTTFADALYYKWTEAPYSEICGIFK